MLLLGHSKHFKLEKREPVGVILPVNFSHLAADDFLSHVHAKKKRIFSVKLNGQ